jgi:hypothetical protein
MTRSSNIIGMVGLAVLTGVVPVPTLAAASPTVEQQIEALREIVERQQASSIRSDNNSKHNVRRSKALRTVQGATPPAVQGTVPRCRGARCIASPRA